MPGAVVHTIVAEHLPGRLEELGYTDVADDALREHREALSYGAQGPDPFYLNVDDHLQRSVSQWVIDWMDFKSQLSFAMYQLGQPMETVREHIDEIGNDALDEVAEHSEVVDQLEDLLINVREVGTIVSAIFKGFIKKMILDNADPFGLYISPGQTCGYLKTSILDDPTEETEWTFDLEQWNWFDTLHLGGSGDFVTELLDIALGEKAGADGETRERNLLLSYAVGYLSHIAADIVGHAYVNSITGGPYRLQQSQRHTTQEKIMDVWAYEYYYDNPDLEIDLKTLNETNPDRYYMDPELVESGFHKNFQFTDGRVDPEEITQETTNVFQEQPTVPINSLLALPEEIKENFVYASGETYDPEYFGTMQPSEVDISYRLWYKFTQSGTRTLGPVHPNELPGDVPLSEQLKDVVEDAVEDAADIAEEMFPDLEGDIDFSPDCLEGAGLDSFGDEALDCLEEAAESITNYATNLARSIGDSYKNALELAATILNGLIDGQLSMSIAALNYLLTQIYERLWDSYQRLLMLVTAIGFGHMYSDDLHQPQLVNMYNPTVTDALDKNTVRDVVVKPGTNETGFPRKGIMMGDSFDPEVQDVLQGLENEGHLLVPDTEIEQPNSIPGPDVYGLSTPEVIISDPDDVLPGEVTGSSDPPLLEWFPDPGENSPSPNQDSSRPALDDFRESGITKSKYTQPVFGDAVTLTVGLFEHYQEHGSIPNLNLSGDRAFAYPEWANAIGCECVDRDRLAWWHGDSIPWLREPIQPVFDPSPDLYEVLEQELEEELGYTWNDCGE